MRPDLPWNVAGISSEAREAARAAARREGLSVGEWLTRRIVSGLADMTEPQARSGDWIPRGEYRPEPERQRRDSETMLDHVSRSESEAAEVYRRIEDQLRGMARRLDASERSQTESNRVMSKAAVEMNIAAREQAQAFDQLGVHVSSLSERLDRVENREPGEGLREAVKALHQGMSRLADQLTQTANQSATQISALANNLENVAGRVGQARHDALVANQALEGRLAALDERVRTLEKSTQANAGSLDRALEAIEAQKRTAAPFDAISRLEENVRRLEQSRADSGLDRRLLGIERALADVVSRVEPQKQANAVEESLRKLVQRLDSLEAAQREAAAELRKAAAEPPKPPVEEPPPPPPGITASFGPLPAFEPPPFVEAPPFIEAAPPPFVAPAANPVPPSFADAFAPPASEVPFTAPGAETPTVESYLAAARRSARVAAQAETERSAAIGNLRWGGSPKTDEPQGKRTRPIMVGVAALVGIAVIAGAILSRQNPPQQQGFSFTDRPAVTKSVNKAAQPTVLGNTGRADQDEAALPPPAKPLQPGEQTKTSNLMPSGVAAPVQTQPFQAAQQKPVRPVTNAPLDRITAAANSGNARAQLIIGLKYLDGDGIPVNEVEAAKWLSRAAEAGEPVAQYRLGTLFERGRGVPSDNAKAARWYLAAANQGSRKAMHNLAVAYYEGAGLKKDFAEAARWFQKAASLGLSDSQFNLAVLYERGLGVPQNLVDAFKWYAIAAAQGDGESKARLTAIAKQLDNEARAAAQHAADAFRPGQLDARANVAPTVRDVTRG